MKLCEYRVFAAVAYVEEKNFTQYDNIDVQVESMPSHAGSSHPPTEKECPPKHLMQEVDHILLGKAVIGLEYTYKVYFVVQ